MIYIIAKYSGQVSALLYQLRTAMVEHGGPDDTGICAAIWV